MGRGEGTVEGGHSMGRGEGEGWEGTVNEKKRGDRDGGGGGQGMEIGKSG